VTTAITAVFTVALLFVPWGATATHSVGNYRGGLDLPSVAGPTRPGGGAVETGSIALAAARAALASDQGSSITSYRWTNASSEVGSINPGFRSGAVMTWDAADGYVLLFGGYGVPGVQETDTWTYLNGSWTNITSSVTNHPPSTVNAAMAYDPSTRSVILFGGYTSFAYRNYTWSYSDRVWTNLTSTSHPPDIPFLPTLATDASANELVTAFVDIDQVAETWTFQDGVWHNVTPTAPLPVDVGLGAADPIALSADPADGGVLAISDMVNGTGYWGLTFVYRAGSWVNLTAGTPDAPLLDYGIVPFFAAPLEYLPAASAVVYFSGWCTTPSGAVAIGGQTWAFVADRWTNLTRATGLGPAPAVLSSSAAAVDPQDSAVVAFGGASIAGSVTQWNPTWILSAPPTVLASSSPGEVDVGSPVTFHGNSTFGAGPAVPLWSFGDGATSSAQDSDHVYAKSGAYAATLTVTDFVGQDGTAATSVVVNPTPSVTVTVTPSSPILGENVTFVASVSGGTGPFTYSWSFGDGSTASGEVTVHAFEHVAADLNFSLNVSDADGNSARASGPLDVSAAPASPVSTTSPADLTSGVGLVLLVGVVLLAALAAVLGVVALRRGPRNPGSPPAAPPPGAGTPPASPPPGA
jgi:hypothetical protein